MKDLDLVLAAVFCMSQGGLTGSGQAVYGSYVLAAVSQGIFLLSAVAGSVAVAVCNGPCHGQGALLVLTEISHTKDACAVGIGIEVAQGLFLGIGQAVQGYAGSVGAAPLRIGEDIDIRLLSVAHGFGFFVHLYVLIRHVLEV